MRTRPSRVLAVAFVLQPARADAHRVAGAQEARVALGQFEAQDVLILRERRDRLARQDDAADRDRHGQHAAGARREDRAFARLLRDDVAIAAHRRQIALGDVEIGLGLVELGLGADAALRQFGDAIVVGLGLVALRLLRGDARVERLHLQGELLVRDQGDLRAGGDRVALLDRRAKRSCRRCARARRADARARRSRSPPCDRRRRSHERRKSSAASRDAGRK